MAANGRRPLAIVESPPELLALLRLQQYSGPNLRVIPPNEQLSHSEIHMAHRIGWLRAAVLGANDGIVSTASLLVGVAAAGWDSDCSTVPTLL
jgi:hypothetical protein